MFVVGVCKIPIVRKKQCSNSVYNNFISLPSIEYFAIKTSKTCTDIVYYISNFHTFDGNWAFHTAWGRIEYWSNAKRYNFPLTWVCLTPWINKMSVVMHVGKFTLITKVIVIDYLWNVYRMINYDRVPWDDIGKHFWLQPLESYFIMPFYLVVLFHLILLPYRSSSTWQK